jgi:amino acid transporter
MPLLGLTSMILLGFLNPFHQEIFQTAWNSMWGVGAYEEVVKLANANGWTPTAFNFNATLQAVAGFGMLVYGGFQNSVQWSGEIKNSKRNLTIGIIAATLISAILFVGLSASVFYSAGNFISQYDYAYYNARNQFHIMPQIEPVVPLFILPFFNGSLFFALLIAVGSVLTVYHNHPAALMMETRRIFAIAFDRFFPERFANVSERFHTPTWAIAFMTIGSLMGIILASPLLGVTRSIFAGINAGFIYLFGYMLTCLALVLLPWRKPQIYSSIRTSNLPIPQIFGVLGFVLSFIFFVMNGLTLRLYPDLFLTGSVMLAGYALFQYYKHSNGKICEAIFTEIPPE